jgi:hypothetical protein
MSVSYQSLLGLSSLNADSISTDTVEISGNLIVEGNSELNILNVNSFFMATGAHNKGDLMTSDDFGQGIWQAPATAILGGDCTGPSDNNFVRSLGGGSIPVDDVLTVNNIKTITYKTLTDSSNFIDASGLRNGDNWVVQLNSTPPVSGQILTYDGANGTWLDPAIPTLSGDASGSASSTQVNTLANGTIPVSSLVSLTGAQTITNKNLSCNAFQLTTDAALYNILSSDSSGNASWIPGPFTGPTGAQGLSITGPTGLQGDAITGPTGSQGLSKTGPTGSQGLSKTGPTGSIGLSLTGPTGSNGILTGPTGSRGFTGPSGAQTGTALANANTYCLRDASAGCAFAQLTSSASITSGRNTTQGLLYMNNQVQNKVICLYDNDTTPPSAQTAINFYGFGVNNGTLRYQVPNTSVHRFYVDSTETFNILAGGGYMLGNLTFPNAGNSLYLPTTGGTPSALNYYEEYAYSTVWTGPHSSPSFNYQVTRIGRVVTITQTTVSGTINNCTASVPATNFTKLPAQFRPGSGVNPVFLLWVQDGTFQLGTLEIDSSGNMDIAPASHPTFTNGNNWGFLNFSISYSI